MADVPVKMFSSHNEVYVYMRKNGLTSMLAGVDHSSATPTMNEPRVYGYEFRPYQSVSTMPLEDALFVMTQNPDGEWVNWLIMRRKEQ